MMEIKFVLAFPSTTPGTEEDYVFGNRPNEKLLYKTDWKSKLGGRRRKTKGRVCAYSVWANNESK